MHRFAAFVFIALGCAPADAGSRFRVAVTAGGTASHVDAATEATAGREIYRPRSVGTLELAKGPAHLEVRPVQLAGAELMSLHKVWLRRLPDRGASD